MRDSRLPPRPDPLPLFPPVLFDKPSLIVWATTLFFCAFSGYWCYYDATHDVRTVWLFLMCLALAGNLWNLWRTLSITASYMLQWRTVRRRYEAALDKLDAANTRYLETGKAPVDDIDAAMCELARIKGGHWK